MATVKFLVLSKDAGRLAPIYMRLAEGNNIDFKVKTEFKILPEAWSKTGKVNENKCNDIFTVEDAHILMNSLGDLRLTILKACKPGTKIDKDWLLGVINKFHHPEQPKSQPEIIPETLNQFFDRYIKEAETGKRLTGTKKRFAASTVKGLKGVQEQFRLYQEGSGTIDWSDIHQDFYNAYLQHFQAKNYRMNTIGRHVKGLKQILNAALDEKLTTNVEHTRRSFKAIMTDVDFVYLTEKELQDIFNLEIKDKPEQALARDIFCVGCYTGQRFSDYSRINKSHIRKTEDGKTVIDIRQKKTGKRVVIPTRWELMEILSRYDNELPHMWEQDVNEAIKKVCSDAKITEKVEITEIIGGMKVVQSIAKNELVKTHTARRTCLTQMYLAGISIADIMAISGHTTEKQLRSYIRADAEGTAKVLGNHAFFNTPKMKVV